MRSAGVRVTRDRLLRSRDPEPRRVRWGRWAAIAGIAWVLWALFLSDHSVARLLQLRTERDQLARRGEKLAAVVAEEQRSFPGPNPSDEAVKRILREKYLYAEPDEIIYLIGGVDTITVIR